MHTRTHNADTAVVLNYTNRMNNLLARLCVQAENLLAVFYSLAFVPLLFYG